MKRIFAIVAAVVVLFLALIFLLPRTPRQAPVAEPQTAIKRAGSRPLAPTPAHSPENVSLTPWESGSAEEDSDRPVAGTVRFEVRDGLAIAMGDLILGTPDDAGTTSGNYAMPNVEYWKSAEMPYLIEQGFPQPERVAQALRHIQSKTGFQFVPYNGQPDAVVFRVGTKDCLSALGRQGGVQPIKLDSECGWHEIAHEVMHAMGFIHEQSRADRDKFVEVLWPHIDPAFADQFDLLPEDFMGPVKDTPFDYHSIMLYDPTVFSKSGQPTLRSRTGESIAPNQSGLSASDTARVKSFYLIKTR